MKLLPIKINIVHVSQHVAKSKTVKVNNFFFPQANSKFNTSIASVFSHLSNSILYYMITFLCFANLFIIYFFYMVLAKSSET